MVKRNYKKEYKNYDSTTLQKIKRAGRNKARNIALKSGTAKKGDGLDIHHRNGNPIDNRKKNLAVTTKTANRSFKRTRNAKKLIRRS